MFTGGQTDPREISQTKKPHLPIIQKYDDHQGTELTAQLKVPELKNTKFIQQLGISHIEPTDYTKKQNVYFKE